MQNPYTASPRFQNQGYDSETDVLHPQLNLREDIRQIPNTRPQNAITTPFSAADYKNDGKVHLLLAASGSVATIKIPNILKALSKYSNLSIRVIFTESAKHFLEGQSDEQPRLEDLTKTPNVEAVYDDADEWKERWTRQSAILHIELRRWADMLVIAPLSANTLAKIVNGIADGLLLSVVRAWDTDGKVDGPGKIGRKRIVVAPAMNTAMWRQPVTARQMKVLEQDWGIAQGTAEEDQQGWFEVLSPIGKPLACGDIGLGGMAEWIGIVKVIEERLRLGGAGA